MSLSGHNKSDLAPAGKRALKFFYNEARKYSAFPFVSFDQFEMWTRVSDTDSYRFIENFGDSVLIVVGRYGWDQVEEKMVSIASDSEGRLPAYPDGSFRSSEFLNAMVEAVSTVNWRTISVDVAAVSNKTATEVFTLAKAGLAGVAVYYILGGVIGIYLLYAASKKK